MKLCARLKDVARAQGPLCSPAGSAVEPTGGPQSLLREALPCRSSSTGSDKGDVSLPSDFALWKGGPGRDGDAVGECVRHGFGDRV